MAKNTKKNKSVVNSCNQLQDVVLHGECMVKFNATLPAGAKLRARPAVGYEIVAPSETTGNHHVVDMPVGVDFYEDEKGTMFMVSNVETNIRCVIADRHDTIALPAGTYEFGSQQEFDPFEARMRAVRD